MLGGIIGLADAVGAEGVGRHHVGAGREIGAGDVAHHIGTGDGEQVVIALLIAREVEPPAVIGFSQAAPLDFRAERAVEDQDAIARGIAEVLLDAHAACSCCCTMRGLSPSRWQMA